jgi:hypothetical protein
VADQSGIVTLLVHPAAVPEVVAAWLVASAAEPVCQLLPFQYLESELRWIVNVVLLADNPTPPELSAALPVNVAGTVAVRKTPPPAGDDTDADTGGVLSSVNVMAVPV